MILLTRMHNASKLRYCGDLNTSTENIQEIINTHPPPLTDVRVAKEQEEYVVSARHEHRCQVHHRIPTSAIVRDLGLAVNVDLSMLECILSYSLNIRNTLATRTAKCLVHALTTSRIDYRNAILYGISEKLLHCLEMVQHCDQGHVTNKVVSQPIFIYLYLVIYISLLTYLSLFILFYLM